MSTLKVNLSKIVFNAKYYKSKLKTNEKLCAVVKADAYGLGAKQVCKELECVVDYFAVSSAEEFYSIKNIATKPILLLDPIYKNITNLAKQNLEFCVSNFKQIDLILNEAETNLNVNFKIHISFNTGMNRFGFNDFEEVKYIFDTIIKTQNVKIIGVFSHFYAGLCEKLSINQSNRLLKLKQYLSKNFDINNIIFHISNTDGFDYHKFDMFRIGFGLYCFNNNSCFELSSKIIEIQNLKRGDTAGYGLNFIAKIDMKIAIVSIGYADGVFRKIAGRGFCLVNGVFCKILAVCMDSILIDVSNVSVKLLDKVVLIGKSGASEIFVCDVALWCDTIEYEIMTSISKRVKRVYIGGTTHANNHRQI